MNLIQDQEILISVNGIVKQFFFSLALPDDASAILSLYRSHIGREFCAWTDDYPSLIRSVLISPGIPCSA